MGATPSHGTTMGYLSGPFRTEDQNPDPEGVALSAHGRTMGLGGNYPRKPVVASLRDAT